MLLVIGHCGKHNNLISIVDGGTLNILSAIFLSIWNDSSTLQINFFPYFQQEREHYEYVPIDGKIIHKLSGMLLDTTSGTKETKWIFVISTSGRLYAGQVNY